MREERLARIARYRRAANFLAAAQVYLQDNCLLEEPLRPEHIKPRLLGHWGTVPGINLVYAHLNRLIRDHDANVLLITGPGHGAAANLANLYLEGTLSVFYPELTRDRAGLSRLVRGFSWPGGFPSHLSPGTPGTIHEGGELGYALATAFGAAFDNPDLLVACIVGDGEAETGPTATAWHGVKYLDPVTCGAVLPILHLNGYKISSPSIFGTMDNQELLALFHGYGYAPLLVDAPDYDEALADALEQSYVGILAIQQAARSVGARLRPRWPMLILRTPKGWSGIKELDGKPVEGSFRSHQVPVEDVRENPQHLALLEGWLRSYHPEELFDQDGRSLPDIVATCPDGNRRMGMNEHAYGGRIRRDLPLPRWQRYGADVGTPGSARASSMRALGPYLRDVIRQTEATRNFRIVCPDELESNRLDAVFEATSRAYVWPIKDTDEHLAPDGRVMEILSEHTCQGWLEGYLLTGRHGLFPCYEAFIAIIDSMVNQYAKFLKQSAEIPWRTPIASLNILLTSEGWRQDHNGYSHQGPGFIDHLLNKKASAVRVYLPPDANCTLQTIDHCLRSTNYINLVIASKQPMPQWLAPDAAYEHCKAGASIWRWASTDDGDQPDVVLAAAGDNPTLELLAAVRLLHHEVPELRVRVVNVTDLMTLGTQNEHPHGLTETAFAALFTSDRPVIFNFHGYPNAVQALLFERPNVHRFAINGYREEGTTTTPLDMHIRNGTSRYHLVMQAAQAAPQLDPQRVQQIVAKYEQQLVDHRHYIEQHGDDPAEVRDWSWA
ncbi:MAG: phosphoketolase family protein [Roseiflexaceae bacterium]|nr:phosphoketolase family protein [Roseiflexaceae bacterium]